MRTLMRCNLFPPTFIGVPKGDCVNGLIRIWELNRIAYLRDVSSGFRRAAAHYSVVLRSLGGAEPLRFFHRAQIGEFVRKVLTNALDTSAINHFGRLSAEA